MNGTCGKLGNNYVDKLYNKLKRVDLLKSLQSKIIDKKTKRNMNRRCVKLRNKVINMTTDLHWKTASWLVKHYDTILLPKFATQNMVRKLPHVMRTLNNKTALNMLTLSHYKFNQRLTYLCNVYNKKLYIVSESYTTKTCGVCGTLNKNIKGNKVFTCPKCHIKLDRDYNAARNILLKNL